jgi:hypothetical protein
VWAVELAIRAANVELRKEGVFLVQLENPTDWKKMMERRAEQVEAGRAERKKLLEVKKKEEAVVDTRSEKKKQEDKLLLLRMEARAKAFRKPNFVPRRQRGGKR